MKNEHLTGAVAPEPLREYKLRKLLTRRQQLADAGIELLCHDLPGGDFIWQAVHEVEELLRQDYPEVWARSNAAWMAGDAARLHTADTPAREAC